jgi:hypothetical protein
MYMSLLMTHFNVFLQLKDGRRIDNAARDPALHNQIAFGFRGGWEGTGCAGSSAIDDAPWEMLLWQRYTYL